MSERERGGQYVAGSSLSMWQHICCEAFVWDDDWVVFADHFAPFGEISARHVAVQFRRRPVRHRREWHKPVIEELEDA